MECPVAGNVEQNRFREKVRRLSFDARTTSKSDADDHHCLLVKYAAHVST
jgi:hypothetical protein